MASQSKVFDIMRLGVSKGRALSILEDKKYFKTSELIIFGDAANDISIFQVSGYSVVMKNAISEAKAVTDSITEFSNQQDGVIKWIERYLNEKS